MSRDRTHQRAPRDVPSRDRLPLTHRVKGAGAVRPEPRASARAELRGAMPKRSAGMSMPCPASGAATVCHHGGTHRHRRRAFSLLELMIGIAILGLGMIMVATIFPVAWSRARTLSEYTAERVVTAGADTVVKSLVRVSTPSKNYTSFQGDILLDEENNNKLILACEDWPYLTDTWVHAMNLENVRVEARRFVDEDPWTLEDANGKLDRLFDRDDGEDADKDVCEQSFPRKQMTFGQRIYPPMGTRENVSADGEFTGDDDTWDDALATRRFAWSILHRLPQPIEGRDQTRSFELYIATLRRPNPNYRYARQRVEVEGNLVPNPCDLMGEPVVPQAMPPEDDVMFPVPWRVQVEFPAALVKEADATGVPTEILVPSPRIAAEDEVKRMLGGMFPTGAYMVDEVTGAVFRVVKRRETGTSAEQAHLTLDREVFVDGKDGPLDLKYRCVGGSLNWALCKVPADCPGGECRDDPRCDPSIPGTLVPCELLRTVWVYPPSVEAERGPNDTLVFEGTPPVVAIDRQVINVIPARAN